MVILLLIAIFCGSRMIETNNVQETCRGAFESASPGQSYDELFLLAIQEKLR
jgi:hypothetical protein